MKRLSALAREPMVQFFVLGAAIFLAYGYLAEGDPRPDQIVVSAGQIDRLVDGWQKTWRRPPTEAELAALLDDYVREEIYYREALAMGLDRDNPVIRRHLQQKIAFLTQDVADQAEPTEEELREFLEMNADSFLAEPRFSFRHVYLSPRERGEAIQDDVLRLLAALDSDDVGDAGGNLGDRLPLPHEFVAVSEGSVAGAFGPEFAARISHLEPGRWHGPVRSGYGLHLVFLVDRIESQTPGLDEVREAVTREWHVANRRAADEELYRRLRERYTVVVETAESNGRAAVAEPAGG